MERGKISNLTVKFKWARVVTVHGPCLLTSQFSITSEVIQAWKADEFKFLLHLMLCDVIFHCSSASILLTWVKTYLAHISLTEMTHYTVSMKHVGWLLKGKKPQSMAVLRYLGNSEKLSVFKRLLVQESLSQS